MSSLAAKLASTIPEGKIKNNFRLLGFKYLFTTIGQKKVMIGTTNDKVSAKVGKLIFTSESLGQREHNGYLKHYHLKKGDVVINAGAYHGYFAIYVANKVGPFGHVYCYELEPNNLRLLRHNIALNNLNNVTVLPYGLWSKNTKLPLISMGSSSTIDPNSVWRRQLVNVRTLDSEIKRLNIKKVNFVTMDIEGAELEALAGAKQTAQQNENINFAIASYHKISGLPSYHAVEQIFRSYNLRTFTDYPPHLTTYAHRRNT